MNQAICRGVKRLAGTAATRLANWSGRAKAARATVPRVPESRPATLSTPDGWAEPPAGREVTGPPATGRAVTGPGITGPGVTGPAATGPAAIGPAAIAPAAVTAVRAMTEPVRARVRRGNVRSRVLLRNTGSLRSGAPRALGFHPGTHTCPQRKETKAAACGRDAGAGRLVAGGNHHARWVLEPFTVPRTRISRSKIGIFGYEVSNTGTFVGANCRNCGGTGDSGRGGVLPGRAGQAQIGGPGAASGNCQGSV